MEMNGFRLSDFPDFAEKWNLVTVRYRTDTSEMRLTYANKLAYESLLKNTTDYPDGSVFAKIGITTVVDDAFPSSSVPGGSRRFQFMVRNKKKFAKTDGCGYAIFAPTGTRLGEDSAATSAACAACHRIVPQRGYVFSQPWKLNTQTRAIAQTSFQGSQRIPKVGFKTLDISELPATLRAQLPQQQKTVQVLEHEIARNFFQGTLDEVRPMLIQHAVQTRQPSLLWTNDRKVFSAIWVERSGVSCQSDGKPGHLMKSLVRMIDLEHYGQQMQFCWTEVPGTNLP